MSRELHSVILNLNKNFSTNNGSNFQTIVNRQLAIKPNTEVALYTGNITRAPIVLSEQVKVFNIRLEHFPTFTQRDNLEAPSDIATAHPFKFTSISIPKGSYSRDGFARQLCALINENLFDIDAQLDTDLVAGKETHIVCPYQCYYTKRDNNIFLGLRYTLNFPTDAPVITDAIDGINYFSPNLLEMNDGLGENTSNITYVNSETNVNSFVVRADSETTDWGSWVLPQSPVRGMCYDVSNKEHDVLTTDVGFMDAQVQFSSNTVTASQVYYSVGSSYFSEVWKETTHIPTTQDINGSTQTIPVGSLFGLLLTSDGTFTTIQVVGSTVLQDINYETYLTEHERDDVTDKPFNILADLAPEDWNIDLSYLTTFRWEIYCEDTPINQKYNKNLVDNVLSTRNPRRYYFRLKVLSPWGTDEYKMIYDSKKDGYFMDESVVETGYSFNMIPSHADPTKYIIGGLSPQVFFYNAEAETLVANLRINNILIPDEADDNVVVANGIETYNFEVNFDRKTNPNVDDIKSILGLVQTGTNSDFQTHTEDYNPNAYPANPDLAGRTVLYSDGQRYNVEVNLPVKAYNSTTQNTNDIGQQRTIIYNTNPVVSDKLSDEAGFVNLNINPNDTKFLSLNNPEEIKVNSLDMQVRRAKTNELATEITDASFEILFRKE